MSRLPVAAALFAAVACAACAKQEDAPYAGEHEEFVATTDPAATLGERRLETASEVVRTLRDRNAPAMLYPTREQVAEAVAAQYPDADLMNDGRGRPFVYELGADGMSYRMYSVGANGIDDGGNGDDHPSRGGQMTFTPDPPQR